MMTDEFDNRMQMLFPTHPFDSRAGRLTDLAKRMLKSYLSDYAEINKWFNRHGYRGHIKFDEYTPAHNFTIATLVLFELGTIENPVHQEVISTVRHCCRKLGYVLAYDVYPPVEIQSAGIDRCLELFRQRLEKYKPLYRGA